MDILDYLGKSNAIIICLQDTHCTSNNESFIGHNISNVTYVLQKVS